MRKNLLHYAFTLQLIMLTAGCSPQMVQIKKTEEHMGTLVSITLFVPKDQSSKQAVDAAFSEISRIDSLLSHYKEDSEVSRLNREKHIKDPSNDLRINIERSVYYGKLSSGAFDITVQPILDLYEESFKKRGRAPTDEEINRVRQRVDFLRIKMEERGISIGGDQKITLGGIAKGYAVDRAIEVLQSKGIEHALVDAGGDIRAVGKKAGASEWIIALRNPRNRNDFITRLRVKDRAVVTSGDYERYFDDEKTFHHIVHPKTGYSATELISATIIAEKAFDADAISTSVFVLGKKKGLELIESLDNVEGLLITREKEIVRSSRFQEYEK